MVASLKEMDGEKRDAVRALIIEVHIALRAFTEAFETAGAMENWEWRARSLVAVALAQDSLGDHVAGLATLAGALRAADRATNGDPRLVALRTVAEAYVQFSEIPRALEIADLMSNDTLSTPHVIELLASIAVAQAQAGDRGRAQSTLMRAMATAKAAELEYFKPIGEVAVAAAQARAGFYDDAAQSAKALVTNRSHAIPLVAMTLVESGDTGSFKGLLVPTAYYRDAAYRMCAVLARAYPERAGRIGEQLLAIVDDRPRPTGGRLSRRDVWMTDGGSAH